MSIRRLHFQECYSIWPQMAAVLYFGLNRDCISQLYNITSKTIGLSLGADCNALMNKVDKAQIVNYVDIRLDWQSAANSGRSCTPLN